MSEPDQDRWPPRSRPRRVEGGLRARSTRGAIGKAWWSKRFLAVLESFAMGGRLTRGRSYARAGQVLSLAVAPGEVTSSVQGSRATPYRTRIGLAPFPALVWAKVEVALAEQAIYSARLLAGEMPPDIEEVFAAAGASLFPRRLDDLSLSCSCPDFAVPCKHLAATFYLLAESFDDDPFQILHWRGRDRRELLDRLRMLRAAVGPPGPAGASGEGAGPAGAGPADAGSEGTGSEGTGSEGAGSEGARPRPAGVAGTALALAELMDTAGEARDRPAPDRFWQPPVPLPPRPPTLDTAPDLLLRQLPVPGSALGGPGLLATLRPTYQRFAAPTRPGADPVGEARGGSGDQPGRLLHRRRPRQ